MLVIDLTGKRFGKLVVLGRAPSSARERPKWLCRCDCGKEKVIRGHALRAGATHSCGCMVGVLTGNRFRTHGQCGTEMHKIWIGMNCRCANSNDLRFPRYGGRGIKVCARWRKSFVSFLRDVGPRPSKQHSLDRIDNNGNYEPSNVRWATRVVQARNSSKAKQIVTQNGESLCLVECAERLKIDYTKIRRMYQRDPDIVRSLLVNAE
jgi:hypothetical protein